jgi:hypothetical protein
MSLPELLRWQWDGYPRYHRSRANLLLHIVVVPLFLAGNLAILVGLALLAWVPAVAGVAATVVSLALQGRGHRGEPVPPEPFTSPLNAVARLLCEQWITFPRFVLSGGWLAALRQADAGR